MGHRLGERGQLPLDLHIDRGDVGVECLDARQHPRQQEPVGRRTWVATTSVPVKICTTSPAVRACRRWPISRHGTEYNALRP